MLHEMLQFKMPINRYKIVLGDNVTQLKGNTTPLTVYIFLICNLKKQDINIKYYVSGSFLVNNCKCVI